MMPALTEVDQPPAPMPTVAGFITTSSRGPIAAVHCPHCGLPHFHAWPKTRWAVRPRVGGCGKPYFIEAAA